MINPIQLSCPHCGTTNRLQTENALQNLRGVRCGSCSRRMLRVEGQPLRGLQNHDLAHPWDNDALEALRTIPFADKLLSAVMGRTLDRLTRFNFLANAVRVNERQAPRLFDLYREAAARLDVDPPPLFIIQWPYVNAMTMGAGEPMVAVSSALLDSLGEREILGVLAHELTHVRLGHLLYRTLALLVINGGLSLLDRFLGLGRFVLAPLQIALLKWYQLSELSADRGELLATGSLDTFVRTHLMIAGGSNRFTNDFSAEAFIEQAREAEEMRDNDLMVYLMENLNNLHRTHPLAAWRVHHGVRWAESADFFRLLAGKEADSGTEGGE